MCEGNGSKTGALEELGADLLQLLGPIHYLSSKVVLPELFWE